MIATAKTHIQWLKMINIKNCSKIINNNRCPCADRLRKITLKIPINEEEEKVLEWNYINKINYTKCVLIIYLNHKILII